MKRAGVSRHRPLFLCGADQAARRVETKLVTLPLEILRLLGEGRGQAHELGRGGAGHAGGLADTTHVVRDLRGALRRAMGVGGDLAGCGPLLLHRAGDDGGQITHVVDGGHDALDRGHRGRGRVLDLADLHGDFVGGLRRLGGEFLHLGGDHREAAARIARPRRLDGGVEGEEVGLLGDLLDEVQHLPDGLGRLGELADVVVGALGLLGRRAGDDGGVRHLVAHLADGGGQLLGGGGDRLHVVGGPLGGDRHRLRLAGRFLRRGREIAGGVRHLAGRAGEALGEGAHAALEGIGDGDTLGDELLRHLLFLALLLGAQVLGLDEAVAEHLEGAGDVADLVLGLAVRHIGLEGAAGDLAHGVGDAVERAGDADDDEGDGGKAEHDLDADGHKQDEARLVVIRNRRGSGRLGGPVVEFNVLVEAR